MSPIWFVDYSSTSKIRTTNIQLFYKLKEAKAFIKENNISGFIIRQDEVGNSFGGFFGDFEPSAQQEESLKKILGARITW